MTKIETLRCGECKEDKLAGLFTASQRTKASGRKCMQCATKHNRRTYGNSGRRSNRPSPWKHEFLLPGSTPERVALKARIATEEGGRQ